MPLRAPLLQHVVFQASAFAVLNGGSLFSKDGVFSVEQHAIHFFADRSFKAGEGVRTRIVSADGRTAIWPTVDGSIVFGLVDTKDAASESAILVAADERRQRKVRTIRRFLREERESAGTAKGEKEITRGWCANHPRVISFSPFAVPALSRSSLRKHRIVLTFLCLLSSAATKMALSEAASLPSTRPKTIEPSTVGQIAVRPSAETILVRTLSPALSDLSAKKFIASRSTENTPSSENKEPPKPRRRSPGRTIRRFLREERESAGTATG